jgi:hypothetical protein
MGSGNNAKFLRGHIKMMETPEKATKTSLPQQSVSNLKLNQRFPYLLRTPFHRSIFISSLSLSKVYE